MAFNFKSKKFELKRKKIHLDAWDTAGQEQYNSVSRMYYNDTHGVILVYDITNKLSFEKLKFWLDDLEINGNKMEVKVMVGTKSDLEVDRQVSMYDAKRFAFEHKLPWMECSAKTGEGVAELFEMMLLKLMETYDNDANFRTLFSHSTVIDVAPAISEADAKYRSSYKLESKKSRKSKEGCC